MMKQTPIMLMRKKGLSGPFFGSKASTGFVAKSIGNAIELGIAATLPVWLDIPDANIIVGQGFIFNLNDYVVSVQPLGDFTIAANALPVGIALNTDGTFSGTATTVSSGSVVFTVSNSTGAAISESMNWVVTEPPGWLVLASVDLAQGSAWIHNLNDSTTGQDPQTFTINTGGLPTGISLNTNGTFSGTITNLSGSGSVTYTSTNSAGTANSGTQSWTII